MKRNSFLDKLSEQFTLMDSEKGNKVFARGGRGTMCPTPWFLEHKKKPGWDGVNNVNILGRI